MQIRIPFRSFAVLVILYWPPLVTAAEPFQLQLTSLSDAWFPAGAVINAPPDKCSELQVRLSQPWSRETRPDAVELTLDQSYPRFTRLIGSDGYLFPVRTREPLGLLTKETHLIEASVQGSKLLSARWTVTRWRKAYLEAVAAGSDGLPIGIQLDSPPGGVVLVGRAGTARFRGRLAGAPDSRLTIDGQPAARLVAKPGYEFDQEIKVGSGAKDIVLKGEDEKGDVTMLVLRIQN